MGLTMQSPVSFSSTNLPAAVQLGREFAQYAIYWIEDGELDFVSCSTGERQLVGLWSERLQTSADRTKS